MATRRRSGDETSGSGPKRHRPATTPQARENQLIGLAYDVAEKQMLDGTASSQVVSHFLKMGSSREFIEQERLANEVKLTQAKIEAMASAQRVEELYKEALTAMRSYAGHDPLELTMDFDDD